MSTSRTRTSTWHQHSSQGHRATQSLALSSVIACLVIGACRLIAHALAFDATQLDGIAFLAALYWALSVIGYFFPNAAKVRARSAGAARRAGGVERRRDGSAAASIAGIVNV